MDNLKSDISNNVNDYRYLHSHFWAVGDLRAETINDLMQFDKTSFTELVIPNIILRM